MNPSSGVSSETQVRPFGVLVVGTRNVCRSPAAERLLRARLGEGAVTVASVGTHAAGGGELPDPLTEQLTAVGAAVDGHEPRELDPDLVRAADVVLTATRQERAVVVRAVPSAIRRTFTLRELARVARTLGPDALPPGDLADRMAALVDAAGRHRSPTGPRAPDDDDVQDPHGHDEAAHTRSFAQVLAAVDDIVATLRPDPATGGSEERSPEPDVPAVRRRSRVRGVVLAALVSLVLLVVAATSGALVAVDRLDSRIQRFPDPFASLPTRPPVEPSEREAAGPRALTVLVLGSTELLGADGDGWSAAAARTDVVMLAHVAADRRSAQVVALPPDLWVEVPGAGPGALRSAVALGGPATAVQAVEQLTDVRVDHVALTDAETFARVTRSLGGVDLDVAEDVVVRGRVVVPAGRQRLTAELALAWMQGAGGDAGARAERGRSWLRAILDRLGDEDVRGDPARWLELLDVLSGSVAVDEGLDRGTMIGLLTSLRDLRPGDVEVVAAPTTAGTAADGSAVVVPDTGPFAALMRALRTDTLDEHLAAGTGG